MQSTIEKSFFDSMQDHSESTATVIKTESDKNFDTGTEVKHEEVNIPAETVDYGQNLSGLGISKMDFKQIQELIRTTNGHIFEQNSSQQDDEVLSRAYSELNKIAQPNLQKLTGLSNSQLTQEKLADILCDANAELNRRSKYSKEFLDTVKKMRNSKNN